MSSHISRREFLGTSTLAAAAGMSAVSARTLRAAGGANERLRVALVGCGVQGPADTQAILEVGGDAVELVALPVGFYAMVHIPSEWLMRGLGIFICLYSLREVLLSRVRPFHIPRKYGVVMGSISGALSGAFHAGGPPAVIYAYSQDWTKEHIVALLQLVFLIPSIIRLILVQNHGLLRTDLLWIGLLAIIPLVLAILGGTHVLHRVKRERLRMIVFVFLFVIGVKYLIKA